MTNIQETINSTTEQINVQKKSTPVCSKLILRRLLVKLATERNFKFTNRFFLKMDGFTMGGPLFVTFSDIYMVKMKNLFVISFIFYWRLVDGIDKKRKIGDNALFYRLNKYLRNIELTIELISRHQNYQHL